jgi:hypothetical protein
MLGHSDLGLALDHHPTAMINTGAGYTAQDQKGRS